MIKGGGVQLVVKTMEGTIYIHLDEDNVVWNLGAGAIDACER